MHRIVTLILAIGLLLGSVGFVFAQSQCGGVSGLGGSRVPDLNSDGCVDEGDVSILLSCWGYTVSNAPQSCKEATAVTNPPTSPPSTPPSPPPVTPPSPPPPSSGSGTTYYVANTGSDSNSGLSESEPWRTIAKVESVNFEPGDTIRFKRGDIWREEGFIMPSSGVAGNPITVSHWGSSADPLPILTGSWDYGSSTALWTQAGGNIWKTAPGSIPREPGHLWRDGHDNAMPLKRETSENGLNVQWDYWYDSANDLLAIYSNSNPAVAATNIEVPIHQQGFIVQRLRDSGVNYIEWDGLALYYARDVNWVTSGTPSNPAIGWVIRNSKVAYCGGEVLQRGNCIDVHGSGQGIVVDNNEVWEPFDSCISPQNWNNNDSINTMTISNNYMHDCSSGVEVQTYSPEGSTYDVLEIRDILIEGNTIDCNGGSFAVGFNQVGDNGIHFVNHARGTTRNVTIRDNVITDCYSPGSSDGNGIRFVTVGSGKFDSDNSGHIIERNRIYSNEQAGIWMECANCSYSVNTTGVIIRNNFIYNNGDEELFFWNNWDNTFVTNNTIADYTGDTDPLIKGEWNDGYEMYNNILVANGQKFLDFRENKVADYNMYYANSTINTQFTWNNANYSSLAGFQTVEETHGISANPLFVNIADNNFNITTASPARDSANDQYHPFMTDFYGNGKRGAAWDRGAHEL